MATVDVTKKAMKAGSFQAMGLEKEILNGLHRMNYLVPTPVQRRALPIVLSGLDVVCMARTGSGKTCVFLLPMVQKLKSHQPVGARGLVLSPTRELALQTFKFAKDMAKFTDLRIISILGGDGMDSQFDALSSKPDVIIATPGRLMHHLQEIKTFHLKSIKYLVFDEADRLFEMGFAEQLNEIIKKCSNDRQTLLFSATLPKLLVQFSRAGLRDPQLVRLDTDIKMSDELRLAFFLTRSDEKLAALFYIVHFLIPDGQQTIIFTATRHHSELVNSLLIQVGKTSTVIYGSMDQDARNANLKAFRNQETSFLVVTDIAARGIDIPLLNNVINYHFPPTSKLFVHRCGRAARQGRVGFAFSLVDPDELPYMCDVHTLLGKDVNADPNQEPYSLEDMTPLQVHTGLLPQHKLNEENDFLRQAFGAYDHLADLFRVSNNAMQQYKRTRPAAGHGGVKKGKQLVKGKQITHIHPLIKGAQPAQCDDLVVRQQAYIQTLQTYRPHLTVFETNIGTGCVNNNHKMQVANKKMMQDLRKTTVNSLERNKAKKALASEPTEMNDGDQDEEVDEEVDVRGLDDEDADLDDEFREESEAEHSDAESEAADVDGLDMMSLAPTVIKKRLSAAEKRKIKKYGSLEAAPVRPESGDLMHDDEDEEQKGKRSFQDSKHYMAYGTEVEQQNYTEEAMQPLSSLRSSETFGATAYGGGAGDMTYEDDPAQDSLRKKKIMRWDPKKRKFVRQTLSEMVDSQKKGLKRMRSEAGSLTSVKSSDKVAGEMYERWKKKRRMEITSPEPGSQYADDEDIRERPNLKVNKQVKSELRSTSEVRKVMTKRKDNELKNLPKEKRRGIEKKQRANKKQAAMGGFGGGRGGGGRGGGGGGRAGGGRGGAGGGRAGGGRGGAGGGRAGGGRGGGGGGRGGGRGGGGGGRGGGGRGGRR